METKQCKTCKRQLPLLDFHIAYGAYRRPDCKDCRNSSVNRAEARERLRDWRRKNPEKAKTYYIKHYTSNKEKEYLRTLEYRRRNPLKAREWCRRYQVSKRGATTEKFSYKEIVERDGLICYLCKREVSQADLVLDHIVPISRGGTHSPDNVKVAHRCCNSKKSNKLLEEL